MGTIGAGALLDACTPGPHTNSSSQINDGPVTGHLTMWGFAYAPHTPLIQKYIAGFTAQNPGVTIDLQSFPDVSTKIQKALISKTAPDIFSTHAATNLLMAESGVLAALEDHGFTRQQLESTFYPSMIDAFSANGKTWGVPMGNNTAGIGMVVDLDAAKEIKWDVPDRFASWDEVWEIAGKLTKKDAGGRIIRSGLNVQDYYAILNVSGMMFEQGSALFDETTGKFSVESAAGIKSLQLLADAVLTHKVDSPTSEKATQALSDGSAAMALTYTDFLPYAKASFPSKHFGFVTRPPIQGNKLITASQGGWGFAATGQGKNVAAAAKFLQYCAQDENLRAWYQGTSSPPPGPRFAQDAYFDGDGKYLKAAIPALPDMRALGKFPNSDVEQSFYSTFQKAISGSLSVQDAAAEADRAMGETYARFKKQINDFK